MVIDFIYRSLREAIIKSYTSGDLDNSFDQCELSLKYLDIYYNQNEFQDPENLLEKKKRLFFKIQASVDEAMGLRVYSMGE